MFFAVGTPHGQTFLAVFISYVMSPSMMAVQNKNVSSHLISQLKFRGKFTVICESLFWKILE